MLDELQKQLRNLAILTITTFFILVAAIGYFYYANYQLAVKGDQAHRGLCTFREDLQHRHDVGVIFLQEHPEGIPGIPAAQLQNSINSQQSTLDALDSAGCE